MQFRVKIGPVFALCLLGFIFCHAEDEHAAPDNNTGQLVKGLQESVMQIVNSGLDGIRIIEEAIISKAIGREEPTNNNCDISSSVTCRLVENGKECHTLVTPIIKCGDVDMTFEFEFCNNNNNSSRVVDIFGNLTTSLIEREPVPGLDYSPLWPGECRSLVVTETISTCKSFFSSSLKVEGIPADAGDEDYCYAWDFYRQWFRRGTCGITSYVNCTLDSTGEPCDDIVVPQGKCNTHEEMTFFFEYCNVEDQPLKFRKTVTEALVETYPMGGLDLSDLPSYECRNFTHSAKVNTCKKFFSSSLKVEGWRGNENGDYCFAWDFYRTYPYRPPVDSTKTKCDVSAKIKCIVTETGEDCDDILVPLDECQESLFMTFEFKYCNNNKEEPVYLLQNTKTIARIDSVKVAELDITSLAPGECRTKRVAREMNTCKKFISARLKVEGWTGEETENVDDDYCFAWDFYRTYVTRPQTPPTTCAVTADIKCTLDETGEDCDDIVVPIEKCEPNVEMTFAFEYCNDNQQYAVTLKNDLTVGLVETVPVAGLTLNGQLKRLVPGECFTKIVRRKVNTCKRFFSASLKVEGKRNIVDDYCFGWFYYRSYPTRLIDEPPTTDDNTSTPDFGCSVSADVTCSVDSTGEDCEKMFVPFEECREDVDMTFVFEYCNNELYSEVDLFPSKTFGLVETVDVEGFNYETLQAGDCRRKYVSRKINTCKKSFAASLKVEGLRQSDGDYCFAYNHLREYVVREYPPCVLTADMVCSMKRTGESCDNLVVPLSECRNDEVAEFTFKYCSGENDFTINLNKARTQAAINSEGVNGLNTNPLIPGQCRDIVVEREINTCTRGNFAGSIKINGNRIGATGSDAADFCYGYDFGRYKINRPEETPAPTISSSPSNSPSGTGTISSSPSVLPSSSVKPSDSPSSGPTDCSGLSLRDREARMVKLISSVSDSADLSNPQSPQSRARDWLIYEDEFESLCSAPCSRSGELGAGVIQRYVLAVFYFSTNGDGDGDTSPWLTCGRNSQRACRPNLKNFNGDPVETYFGEEVWLSPVSECLWGGLTCKTQNECLDRIEFEANNVGGTIPTEIEQFYDMRFLYLEGAIDTDDYLSGSLNLLEGEIPAEVVKLDALLILDLNYNTLQGEIPIGVFGMTKLRQLDLNHNLLSGTIPTEVGNLDELRFLQFDNNQFSGPVPAEFGNLDQILTLELFNNTLTGEIPAELCTRTNINDLTADCTIPGAVNYVYCGCCTACYPFMADLS